MTKHSMYNKQNRDASEPGILQVLKAWNVRFTQMRPGDGFDLLVWISPPEFWEIKSPDQPPSKRKLTDSETDSYEYCRNAGITYMVVMTEQEALDRINKHFERK